MCFYGEGSMWTTDPFYIIDEEAFCAWLDWWPEVAIIHRDQDGRICLGPSDEVFNEWCDLPWIDLPTHIREPNGDGSWYLPEEAGDIPDEMLFLYELSNHVDDYETCVLRYIAMDWGHIQGRAYAIVGGEASPESRVAHVDLDEAYGRGLALEGGRIAIGYYDTAAE